MVEQTSIDEAPADTKVCGTCDKAIESAKFRLHEVACARNNFRCPKCREVIPKADREQHELDSHTEKPEITCDQCPDFRTKDPAALSAHKAQDCKNRSQAHAQAQPLPRQVEQGNLQKCSYCPMEFTQQDIANHQSYCGGKTKDCEECGSKVQNWMMESHRTSGACANAVLDRHEQEDQQKIRQVMEQSAFAQPKPVASSAMIAGGAVAAQQVSQAADDGMDENEREIARIMQEEAAIIDGGHAMQQEPQPPAHLNQPEAGHDGVRAPDDSRMQVLAGPYQDMDPAEEQRLQQERINAGIMGGIGSGISNVVGAIGSGIGHMFGYGAQQEQPQPIQQPGGVMHGQGAMSEEEQIQMAMAASMDHGQVPVRQGDEGVADRDQMRQNAEDEAMARAIAASMNAERSSVAQIAEQNSRYEAQMAQGFEDEDAQLARALAESQNQ